MTTAGDNRARKIVFIHPDLGIGGAERLVIDAAVGLQSRGHKVTILTSHHDPKHSFEEARDGTLDVRVRGNAIFPSSILGRFGILCAILRQLALVLSTAVFSSEVEQLAPDVFFVDQLSACIPFLKFLCPEAKILFYGHFPDRLLAKEGSGAVKSIKALYRKPFDALESWSTGCADDVVVNSKFTRSVFKQTFPSMRSRELKVIYPCVDTNSGNEKTIEAPLWPDKKVLLSINRYEGKKNLSLAIRAFAGLSSDEIKKAVLVIAGGYDSRVHENANTLKELEDLAGSLKLTHSTYRGDGAALDSTTSDVVFLLSVDDKLKRRLLSSASLLIYTPKNEHFGIVPIEAMLAGLPVLATNTGGPLETIYDGRTGWLRSPEKVAQWTDVMRKPLIASSADNLRIMGQTGRKRVLAEFSREKMINELDKEIQRLGPSQRPSQGGGANSNVELTTFHIVAGCIAVVLAILGGIYGMKVAAERLVQR